MSQLVCFVANQWKKHFDRPAERVVCRLADSLFVIGCADKNCKELEEELHTLYGQMPHECVASVGLMKMVPIPQSIAVACTSEVRGRNWEAVFQLCQQRLKAVQQAGGTLTAPSDGTLVSLDLVVGQPSPAVGGQLAADADFTAEIPLEESQANLVSVDTELHLSQSRASCDAAVQSLSAPDENGTVTAKCTLSKGAWCAGAANASATVQGEKRPCVLPASAVHKDNTGCYVLAIEQKATILGQQNIVVSLPVTVVETGDTTAAVSGALDADTQVIVSSTRAVQAGDRVKIHDAS